MKTKIIYLLILVLSIFIAFLFINNDDQYIVDLKNPNPETQKAAIGHLSENKVVDAVSDLSQLLIASKYKDIRLLVINALGDIGEESAFDVLVPILEEEDSELKLATIEALGKIRNTKAIPALAGMAMQEVTAVDGKQSGENTLPSLSPNVPGEMDEMIRLSAIWAIGNIKENEAVTILIDLLHDSNKYVRYNSAQALNNLGKK